MAPGKNTGAVDRPLRFRGPPTAPVTSWRGRNRPPARSLVAQDRSGLTTSGHFQYVYSQVAFDASQGTCMMVMSSHG
jgi:hypothetical protein